MTSYGGYEPTDPTFVPVAEAAAALGVPAAWLRDEARAGRVPALIAGKRVMVNLDQVRRALLGRAEGAGLRPDMFRPVPGAELVIVPSEPGPPPEPSP